MAKKQEPDKLEQEVSQAIAAGMTYGRWKALQPPAQTESKPIPDGWLVCEYCGKPFKPRIKTAQRFCEVGCQKRAYSEKHKKKNAAYVAQHRAKKGRSKNGKEWLCG